MAIDHNKLLVIHIPRNGSTCIPWGKITNNIADVSKDPADSYIEVSFKETLTGRNRVFNRAVRPDEHQLINAARKFKDKRDGRYDSLLELSETLNLSDYTKLTIVRNPFTRTYSLYNHYVVNLCNLQKNEKPFLNFLQDIKLNRPQHPKSRGLAKKTQTSFIVNSSNVIDNTVNIFKGENLEDLKTFLGLESTHIFPKHNRRCFEENVEITPMILQDEKNTFEYFKTSGQLYTTAEMQNAYTQECIDIVLDVFSEDFDNFNYSRNFADAI